MPILLLAPLLVAAASQDAPLPPPPEQKFEIPADARPTDVHLRGLNLAPGASLALHVHAGVEMAYVVQGDIAFRLGGETVVKHAGESFQIARGTVHGATNVGTGPARITSAFVVDRGAPLRIPVGADGKPMP